MKWINMSDEILEMLNPYAEWFFKQDTNWLDEKSKAHEKNTTGGHYVERYFIKEFEEPSDKYPAGRMKEKEIDIIDICLPPHLHFSASKEAMEAGKHVI